MRRLHAAERAEGLLDACELIYNRGIEGRQATFETSPRVPHEIKRWLTSELPLLVAVDEDGRVLGFANVGADSDRCVYEGVGEHAVYVSAEPPAGPPASDGASLVRPRSNARGAFGPFARR
jgi:L-amino acid N-acyltransferase YncA